MRGRVKLIIGGGIAAAALATATGIAVASSDDDAEGPDTPITGDALDRASAAALDFTGEGRVTETEAGDEESAYEVEVTLDDGTQVDVQLDENFVVVGSEHETEGTDD